MKINRYIITLLFLFRIAATAQLPVLQWAGAFKSTITNTTFPAGGTGIGIDRQGNVYCVGSFGGTVDFDPGPATYTMTGGGISTRGIYVVKLNPGGSLVWAKQIPLTLEFAQLKSKVDSAGNIYITSDLRWAADMDPGAGTFVLTPMGVVDDFIVKWDTNGNFVWAKQFGGTAAGTTASAIETDRNGNVMVSCVLSGTADFDPGPNVFNLTSTNYRAYLTRLDINGNLVWAKAMGSPPGSGGGMGITDIQCNTSGTIYTTGSFGGQCDFDPGPATYYLTAGSGSGDGYVLQLDLAGNFGWAKKFGNSSYGNRVECNGMTLDGNNNIHIAGAFSGVQDFDGGTAVFNLSATGTSLDGFILKLNATGDFQWAKQIGGTFGERFTDVVVDAYSNVYAAGFFTGTVDYNPGPGVYTLSYTNVADVLVKLNAGGDFVYAAPFENGTDIYANTVVNQIAIDSAQTIYVTGFFSYTYDFDPGPNVYPVTTGYGESAMVVKLNRCNTASAATLNISACQSYTLNNEVFDSSGTYTRVIPNVTGCDSVITLHLTINKKRTEQYKSICEGAFFFAGGSNQTTAGTYYDTVQTAAGCDSVVTTHLSVVARPAPNLGADRDLCQEEELTLSPGTFTNYRWQDGSTQSTYKITTTGVFWVTVTDATNCSATDSLRINTINPNPAGFLKPADSICQYEKRILAPSGNYRTYSWSTGATTDKIEVTLPGLYWLTVTSTKGCMGKDTTTLYPKNCISGVYVPIAFTPNGDGRNDWFKALVHGRAVSFALQVYDRYGRLIFQTNDPSGAWNGNVNGTPSGAAVFVWQCSYQLENQPPAFQKGTVTLIR